MSVKVPNATKIITTLAIISTVVTPFVWIAAYFDSHFAFGADAGERIYNNGLTSLVIILTLVLWSIALLLNVYEGFTGTSEAKPINVRTGKSKKKGR